MSNISLYCLPYSGGSAAMYYKWRNVLSGQYYFEAFRTCGEGNEQ